MRGWGRIRGCCGPSNPPESESGDSLLCSRLVCDLGRCGRGNERKMEGDSAPSDFRVFPGFWAQKIPVSPLMARLSQGLSAFGGARVRGMSGSAGSAASCGCARPSLCAGIDRGEPVLPCGLRALGQKQRRGLVPEGRRGGSFCGPDELWSRYPRGRSPHAVRLPHSWRPTWCDCGQWLLHAPSR